MKHPITRDLVNYSLKPDFLLLGKTCRAGAILISDSCIILINTNQMRVQPGLKPTLYYIEIDTPKSKQLAKRLTERMTTIKL